ncbi:MAG: DUF523 domain-containing protein [Taibaiella sp.]|nr:DUF523 domain-containing protein [Taibaiella sp.]
MTDQLYIRSLRQPTAEQPLRILMSACLAGITCGYDGTANGTYPSALKLFTYPTVSITKFCPEDFSFGSPREMCDIHGGSGLDVLEGRAQVLTETGVDWSAGMIKASERMLEIAQQNEIELAVLMDISAACGSQVIYDGNRFAENKVYQVGAGVCAAQLMRHGIKVISQRDFASLELLYNKLDPAHIVDTTKIDHHETEWYRSYFHV